MNAHFFGSIWDDKMDFFILSSQLHVREYEGKNLSDALKLGFLTITEELGILLQQQKQQQQQTTSDFDYCKTADFFWQ
jgi:hypothetical protein